MATSQVQVQHQLLHVGLRHQTTIIALSLTVLGAILRLHQVGANGYSLDETWSLWVTRQSPSDLVQVILLNHGDNTPPTYYLLLQLFTQVGLQPLAVRGLSVLAGTAAVWLTFRLAAALFDWRVATLSAFLVAVSPLHIQYSQLARAYMLADLWALCSLYFFACLVFRPARGRHWVGLVAASAAAFCTFYMTFLVIAYENILIAGLWLRRRLARVVLRRWLISQAVVAIVFPITSISLFLTVSVVDPGRGLTWLARPDFSSLIKSAILFTTGDPSFGPIGVTPARILSLAVVVGLGLLVVWVFFQHGGFSTVNQEGPRALFLAGAVLFPVVTTLAISQVRPIYHQKYLLYVLPPLVILLSWAIVRSRKTLVGTLALLSLTIFIGRALFVFYSAPVGEQWRESIAYMRPQYQPTDLVLLSPGSYMRPFAYYYYGAFPPDTRMIARSRAVLLQNGQFRTLQIASDGQPLLEDAGASAQRLWFVTGYSPPDGTLSAWLERNYESVDTGDFLGASVQLLRRVNDSRAELITP